ncbi:MAG: hypothetical protein NC084_04940 [Bacteroides sp.]|nr:hypothetical protein [Eubacterium sp.]MCM1418446.1 hypothetical protein [Roseburia sp.]MCM1462042.1 hypothetical protein [Bacteroides sp.]
MKKTIALIAAVALLASCAAETTPTETTTPPAETTTPPAETTTEPETTPPPETMADRGERIDVGVASFYYTEVDPALLNFYKNEAEEVSGFYSFDYAYAFGTSVYDDSELHPERFDVASYRYDPAEEYRAAEPFEIRAGDSVGGYRIKSAKTMIAPTDMGYGENTIIENGFELDGEYTFTGVLRFFYEEDYMIGAGEIQFFPAEPLTDFPVPLGFGATPPSSTISAFTAS